MTSWFHIHCGFTFLLFNGKKPALLTGLLSFQIFRGHRKFEIRVRIRLFPEREVPPFAVNRVKSPADHRALQNHPVSVLPNRNRPAAGMRNLAEPVIRASHIDFFSARHVEQRKVNHAAAAVARLFGDISSDKKLLFFEFRIKIRFHPDILVLDPPEHKMPYGAGRPVGIEYFQTVTLYDQFAADRLESAASFVRSAHGFSYPSIRSPIKLQVEQYLIS